MSYDITLLSTAVSRLTHMSGTEGNEAILAREAVVTPNGVQYVPTLSGNQIRHRMVRAPGWRWLMGEYGWVGKLSLRQLNFLMHGGSLTDSTRAEDLTRVADWQRIFPLGRLLGGSLPDQILEGSLKAWSGTFVCRENQSRLAAMLPEGVLGDRPLRAAQSLVDGWQYTRSSAGGRDAGLYKADEDDDDALMIYAGQSVNPGAAFVHGFSIPHGSILELGALLWSLKLWKTAGAHLGGMSAKGHGRLATAIVDGLTAAEVDEAVDAYLAYIPTVKDEATAWIDKAFARKPDDGKGKPKGKTKAKPEPKPEPAPEPVKAVEPSLFGDDDGEEDAA